MIDVLLKRESYPGDMGLQGEGLGDREGRMDRCLLPAFS